MPSEGADAGGCVIEIQGFSREPRGVVLARLHRTLRRSGCWTVGFSCMARCGVQYSFDVELSTAMELYCGLVEAGLELTELSHRALTELCVLRSHECTTDPVIAGRIVKVELMVGFVDDMDVAAGGVIAALA